MKINWFSPLPPAKTGISEYTSYVVPALQNYSEVVLWTDQANWSSEIEQYADVRHYQPTAVPWKDINQADVNIYHIGNNPDFHAAIWQVSRQCPGLVVLHEPCLQHFFSGISLKELCGWDEYVEQMMRYYGSAGRQAAEGLRDGLITVDFLAQQYPLTFLALENALGVITHTREAFNALKQVQRWPALYVPLPYPDKQYHLDETLTKAPSYRIVLFGHLGYNRRLEQILEAISRLNKNSYFHLDIYGSIEGELVIYAKIKKLGLHELVTIHNFVQKSELDSALAKADIAINLRYPSMGEASLSQLYIWSHALPSLVTKVGWYAELPDNAVAFVRPEQEIEDIQQHLQNFIENPQKFVEMGRSGREILSARHNPIDYAQTLMNFASNHRIYTSYATAYKLAENVGKQMSLWSSHEISDMHIERVAKAIYFLTS